MAPPIKPDDQRKKQRGVSLTDRQHETLLMMGASPWLQNILDHERALIDAGCKALPHLAELIRKPEPKPAKVLGPRPGHAMPSKSGVLTHKTRVLRAYGLAHCDQHGDTHYIIAGNCGIHEALGHGSSPQLAWKDAANNLTKKAKAA